MSQLSVNYETLKFWDAYGVAEAIRFAISENPENETLEDYFDINDEITRQRFTIPQRWTLLHQFIEDRYLEHDVYGFEKHRDDMHDLVVLEYETVLKGYGITPKRFKIPPEMADNYEPKMLKRIKYLRSLLPVQRIVNETFQILFGDRQLLLQFNQIVAMAVSSMKLDEFPEILSKDGVIQRKSLPVWAKRGVFYRDKGRCIHCGKDLTGSVVTGEQAHYDHILPLSQGGTNDPTNFQLLCQGCNLSKATKSSTSDRYPVYWSLED